MGSHALGHNTWASALLFRFHRALPHHGATTIARATAVFPGKNSRSTILRRPGTPRRGPWPISRGPPSAGTFPYIQNGQKCQKCRDPHSLPESTPSPTSKCQGICCFQAEFLFGCPWGFIFYYFGPKPCPSEAGCLA